MYVATSYSLEHNETAFFHFQGMLEKLKKAYVAIQP